MIQEAYVSYEVAKLLKKGGFDESCRSYFISNSDEYRKCTVNITSKNCISGQMLRPTHQMACAWLREEHNLFIEILTSIDLNGKYLFKYVILNKECEYVKIGHEDVKWKYEDAVEAALKYVLENLI